MLNSRGIVTRLSSGFTFTEGPVWDRRTRSLIFNDIPAARTWSWCADRGLEPVRRQNNKSNGSAIDLDGDLLMCEHATSALVRWDRDGRRSVLAERFRGRALNSPNDVIVLSSGFILFTDPPFGRALSDMGVIRERELDFSGVYCLAPHGELRLLSDRLAEPNGLCVDREQSFLYVNDTASGEIVRFALSVDGGGFPTVDTGDVWAVIPGDATGSVDGMKIDSVGRLHCTGPGGIHVLDAAGDEIVIIEVPEPVGNFAWGDDDGRTLYMCASTSLYSVRTEAPGFHV